MPKEYIDKEAVKRILVDKYNFFPVFVKNAIEEASTADVVEVVRCGECIHSKRRFMQDDAVICEKYMTYKGIKGFCNEGERKSK